MAPKEATKWVHNGSYRSDGRRVFIEVPADDGTSGEPPGVDELPPVGFDGKPVQLTSSTKLAKPDTHGVKRWDLNEDD